MLADDLSWFPHISSLVAKASKRANAILKSFVYSDFRLLAQAYITYVRPMLETACAVWSPHYKQDKVLVESVQRKFSRKLFWKCNLQPASYEDRLAVLNWSSLEDRRKRADLLLTYRILKGQVDGAGSLLHLNTNAVNLRGNATRLVGERSRLDIRKYSYSQRIVDSWNALKVDISNFRNATLFSEYLDRRNVL